MIPHRKEGLALVAVLLVAAGCSRSPEIPRASFAPQQLEEEVFEAERAFAQSMADRHFKAFKSFLAEDVVFFCGEEKLRGKQAVAAVWQRYFEGENPPFAWAPERVAALAGQALALSRGPVTDPGTGEVLGTFTSVWQLDEVTGEWKVILDIGGCACEPE